MTGLYLEDYAAGQRFATGSRTVDTEAITTFARQYDPQPFHLDDEAAKATIFGGLAASGWHTAVMTIGLLLESDFVPASGIVGAGFDEFRWAQPVRPGDTLRAECEILEVRASKSRPGQGLIKVKTTTLNQKDEPVLVFTGNLMVPCRPA